MSAAFDWSTVLFHITTENKLVAPAGYDDIGEAIAALRSGRPKVAESNEECILIAESAAFALQLPGHDEHLYLDVSYATENTCLECFWAIEDMSGESVLIVYNMLSGCPKDNEWIVVRDEWQEMPFSRQLVRRYKDAAKARADYPNDIVVVNGGASDAEFRQKYGWWSVEVHSYDGAQDDGVRYATHPSIRAALRLPEGVEIPLGKVNVRRVGGEPFLVKDLFPSPYGSTAIDEAVVVMIGFTERARFFVLARAEDDKTTIVRFFYRGFSFLHSKTLFQELNRKLNEE